MPEGDTIHRAAGRLRPALEGQTLMGFTAPRLGRPLPALGETIESIRVHGKHLLVDFSGGLTLRVHLRMTGSWHLYRTGSTWRRSKQTARVIIEVEDWVAVCFNAPDVAMTKRAAAATGHLGPDLCEPKPDFESVLQRTASLSAPDRTIGEIIMDQRIASGIGNVYKSESLFAERLDPTTPLHAMDNSVLEALYRRANTLMRANLNTSGPRTTVAGGYAVYGRHGQPCRRCAHGTVMRIMQGGDHPRSTYYCPDCQVRPRP